MKLMALQDIPDWQVERIGYGLQEVCELLWQQPDIPDGIRACIGRYITDARTLVAWLRGMRPPEPEDLEASDHERDNAEAKV